MNLIKSIMLVFLSPILFVIVIELTLFLLYQTTHSKYFESFNETVTTELKIDFSDLNRDKTKVAIFGGSSAFGYASPASFSDLIQKAYPNEFIIHNYARPGDPFVGFQSEYLKLVIPYYDVIIIYAGHNEIWSKLYLESAQRNVEFELLDGSKVDGASAILKRDQKLAAINRGLNAQQLSQGVNEVHTATWLLYSLRSANLMRRVINRLRPKSEQKTSVQRLPLFDNKPIVDNKSKDEISRNFLKEINDLTHELHSNQNLIISTVLSNDLYPPSLGVLNTEKTELLSSKFTTYYKNVFEDNIKILPDMKLMPDSSHKSFLEGKLCLAELIKPIEVCRQFLVEARRNDGLPYRALPEISQSIKSLRHAGDTVDPEADLRLDETYLKYFVDFQHPSLLGHMLIANKMLKALGKNGQYDLKDHTPSSCDGNLVFLSLQDNDNMIHKSIILKRDEILRAHQTNIDWLNKFLKSSAVRYMHDYYLKEAIAKLEDCSQ